MILTDDNDISDKKQNKINNIINDNLDYLKKELEIKKIPHIENNKPIFEFVYGVDFKNNKSKVYLGYFPGELEIGESFEFDKNNITQRTYYQKKMTDNIFNKYKLLKNYQNLFNYKNFDMYYIRKKNKNIDQVGLIYNNNNNIQIKNFIMLFTKICDKLKWKKKNLLKVLNKNKHKIINIISFGDGYINIYYLDNNIIEEITESKK